MSVRDGGTAALAAWGSSAQPGHLGRGARLVDEDQLLGVEVELAVEPGLPGFENIGALLLRRVRGLSERQAVSVEKGPGRCNPDREATLAGQTFGDLGQ